jgi:hypothetical protein
MLLLMMVLGTMFPGAAVAFAKDGDSGGDGGGGDGGGSDDGGGGSDDGGGGSDDGGGGSDDDSGGDHNDNSGSDRDDDRDEDDDDDRIRSAVKSGKAEPLRKILATVRKKYKGKVVRIRLSGKGNKMVYRIRMIEADDRLIEVRVNAASGRIIEVAGVSGIY